MNRHRIIRTAALSLALAAIAAPVAGARPDMSDVYRTATTHVAPSTKTVDLRSPDARDAAAPSARPRPNLTGFYRGSIPQVAQTVAGFPATSAHRAFTPATSNGTDWKVIGIAGGCLLVLALAGLGAVASGRRRTAGHKAAVLTR
jgi:hypothetical protein